MASLICGLLSLAFYFHGQWRHDSGSRSSCVSFTVQNDPAIDEDRFRPSSNSHFFQAEPLDFASKYSSTITLKSVETLSGRSSKSTSKLVLSREPRVLVESLVKTWEALNWDLWHLAKDFSIIQGVHWLTFTPTSPPSSRVFLIHEHVNPTSTTGILVGTSTEAFQAPIVEDAFFVDYLSASLSSNDSEQKKTLFFAMNYRVFEGIANKTKDTQWKKLKLFEPLLESVMSKKRDGDSATKREIGEFDKIAPQLWSLYPSSGLQARYSAAHTMRVQIKGSSRYTLFPPSSLSSLHLFPSIHAANMQSQLDFYEGNFSSSLLSTAQTVVLQPAQILHIPPYWLTLTETQQQQISLVLDIQSASAEQLILEEAAQRALPFPASFVVVDGKNNNNDKARRVVAAQVFLIHILSRLVIASRTSITMQAMATPKLFSRWLYTTRYQFLYPENSLVMMKNKFVCYRDDPSLHSSIVEELDPVQLSHGAQFIADCLNDPILSDAVRREWLGNYVEQVGRWALEDAEEVVFFIRECLDFENVIPIQLEEEGHSIQVSPN